MTTKDLVYAGIARFIFGFVCIITTLVVVNSCATTNISNCDMYSNTIQGQLDKQDCLYRKALNQEQHSRGRYP